MAVITFFLLLPPVFITAFSPELRSHIGPKCPRKTADGVLAGYGGLYLLSFMAFAYELRTVFDGFHIKEELRASGIIGLFVVITWIVFNTGLRDINDTIFPFSTVFLLLGIAFTLVRTCFVFSVWCVYS